LSEKEFVCLISGLNSGPKIEGTGILVTVETTKREGQHVDAFVRFYAFLEARYCQLG